MADSTSENSLNPTRASLLLRIRDNKDAAAWEEFHGLYAPLLYNYARARGLNHDDAEDIRSECYESLVRQMQDFEYDRSRGSFKAWLRTIVVRRVIDRMRKRKEQRADTAVLRELPAANDSEAETWNSEWRKQHLRFCVEQVKPSVPKTTWQAFKMLAETNASVPEVCDTLKLTANQVYKAKARMLELVRERLKSLEAD